MLKRSSLVSVAFLSIALLFFATACVKEPSGPKWDIDVAVPLIRTTLTIADLVPDSLLTVDASGNVTLVYSSQLFTFKLDTVLQAPDTSFRYSYFPNVPPPFLLSLFPGTNFSNVDDVTRFDLDQLELRELRVRSGTLNLEMVNRVSTNVLGDFGLPGATLGGASLALDVVVPPGTSAAPSTFSVVRPLDGYVFDLRGPDFNDVNTLATDLSFTTDISGPTVQMGQADSLEAIVRYTGIVPAYARGYFGMREIPIDPDTTQLDLFENISGMLDLDDATARLKVRNGLGVDARAHINYLRSINTNTLNTVDLVHPITSGPINLDRALDLGSSFQAAQNNYLVNAGNSNIVPFIENLPTGIAFDLDVTIDPLGDVSNGNDFFYYESTLSADLEVEIPLRLAATDIAVSTITTVELTGTLADHAFQGGTLHVFATNHFPFSATLALHIVDSEGAVLALLPPGGSISSAQVNGSGLVSNSVESQVDFVITKEQLDLFYPGSPAGPDGARLKISATFNTADQPQPVQLRSDHKIDILVSLEGNYIVNGDE